MKYCFNCRELEVDEYWCGSEVTPLNLAKTTRRLEVWISALFAR